jgi:malonyl CoA-acyl carrier protein transacylase
MTNSGYKNIGIIGMACSLTHAPDLAAFRCHCLIPRLSRTSPKKGWDSSSPSTLLKDTIQRALADAGLSGPKGMPANMKIVLCSSEDRPHEEGTGIFQEPDISVTCIRTTHHTNRDYVDIHETIIETLDNEEIDFVVLAALQTLPEPQCIVLVFGGERAYQSNMPAYALMGHMEKIAPEQFTKKLRDLSSDGYGHLVYLGKSFEEAGQENPVPQKHPVHPVCFLSRSMGDAGPLLITQAIARCALSLNNKIIFPGTDQKNTTASWEGEGYYANGEIRPWIHDPTAGPRKAGLLSPGINVPLVLLMLEEVAPPASGSGFDVKPVHTGLVADSELVVLSAEGTRELCRSVDLLIETVSRASLPLDHIAFLSCNQFNYGHTHRLAMVCISHDELAGQLAVCRHRLKTAAPDFGSEKSIYYSSAAAKKPGKVACLFPGLGFPGLVGAYADHLKTLALHFPEFRKVFDDVESRDRHPTDGIPSSQLFFPPDAFTEDVRSALRKRMASPRIEEIGKDNGHPRHRNLSSFGVSVANQASWKLLKKLNISPELLFGQSLGELSALCAGEVIDFKDFVDICWRVPIDTEEYLQDGRLALVSAGAEFLEPFTERYEGVHIAIHVGPEFQIIGGETKTLSMMVSELRKAGVWTHFLPFPAIHTPTLSALRNLMAPHLKALTIRPTTIPVYSCVTGKLYPDDMDAVRELMIANIDHPVFLWQTTRQMYEDGVRVMIQVGGGATMYAQAKTNIDNDDLLSLSMDVDFRSALSQLHHVCAALIGKGMDVDLGYLYRSRGIPASEAEKLLPDNRSTVSIRDGQGETGMPFIGTIMKFEPASEIDMEREIDINRDLFLRDHLFVNAGKAKPHSECLPVVPMTLSIEMMAEAAACLAPGCGLTGFENVRASRWIALLDADRMTVRITARFHHVDEVTGIHHVSAAVYTPESKHPAIEGTVLLGKRYTEALIPEFSPIDEPYAYPFKPDEIYRDLHLFHGPTLQCVSGDVAFTGKKLIGRLAVLPKHELFAHNHAPVFLCDPVLLDGVGQLLGLWAIVNSRHVFPIGIKKLEIYRPAPAVGTLVPILLEIKRHNSKLLTADVEIQDGEGRVWMRICGWEDWVFNWPKGIYDFRRKPERYVVSHGMKTRDMPENVILQYLLKSDLKDMWLDVAARFFLGTTEMKALYRMDSTQEQWQWLMGRIVLKDALRLWIADQSGRMPHPALLLIEDGKDGRPVVKQPDVLPGRPVFNVLCSNGGAVAVVSRDGADVNLERILSNIKDTPFAAEKDVPYRH